jgi:hypothetical protein
LDKSNAEDAEDAETTINAKPLTRRRKCVDAAACG